MMDDDDDDDDDLCWRNKQKKMDIYNKHAMYDNGRKMEHQIERTQNSHGVF